MRFEPKPVWASALEVHNNSGVLNSVGPIGTRVISQSFQSKYFLGLNLPDLEFSETSSFKEIYSLEAKLSQNDKLNQMPHTHLTPA